MIISIKYREYSVTYTSVAKAMNRLLQVIQNNKAADKSELRDFNAFYNATWKQVSELTDSDKSIITQGVMMLTVADSKVPDVTILSSATAKDIVGTGIVCVIDEHRRNAFLMVP